MTRHGRRNLSLLAGTLCLLSLSCAVLNMLSPEKGADLTRTEPVGVAEPYRSPNGHLYSEMAYGSGGYIFLEPYGDYDPSWSPDGSRLVFASDRDGDLDIYVIDEDGSNLVNLTPDPSPVLAAILFMLDKTRDTWPDWSPAGGQILFSSTRTNIMMNSSPADIYSMGVDGTQVVQLTDTTDMEGLPDASPDGQQVLFVSDRDEGIHIYAMRSDGSNIQRLTLEGEDNDMPDWSPRGERVVFQSVRDGNADIYVMDGSGENIVRLTDDPGMDTQPVWSPDGNQIAFISDREGDPEIYLMNADGSHLSQLTDNDIEDYDPAWSPDGGRMAYASATAGGRHIFIIDLDTLEMTQITGGEPIDPPQENAIFHLHRGLALYTHLLFTSEGDFDGVIEAFSRAIDLDPSLAEAYLGRGMAMLHRCEILWVHVVGSEVDLVNENDDCSEYDAASGDIEHARQLGLAPALTPGVENLIELLR